MPRGPKGEKRHKSLRVTPAMAAALTDKLMDWLDVVAMIDNRDQGTN
jgi:hypothetical protein